MPNRFEQEFPCTSWRVVPPLGPRGRERDVIRRYIARGRRLRSEAVRRGLRDAAGATARAMASLAASVRGAGRGLPKRPRERDGWASPAQGA
jgi:hypothetical protein